MDLSDLKRVLPKLVHVPKILGLLIIGWFIYKYNLAYLEAFEKHSSKQSWAPPCSPLIYTAFFIAILALVVFVTYLQRERPGTEGKG